VSTVHIAPCTDGLPDSLLEGITATTHMETLQAHGRSQDMRWPGRALRTGHCWCTYTPMLTDGWRIRASSGYMTSKHTLSGCGLHAEAGSTSGPSCTLTAQSTSVTPVEIDRDQSRQVASAARVHALTVLGGGGMCLPLCSIGTAAGWTRGHPTRSLCTPRNRLRIGVYNVPT